MRPEQFHITRRKALQLGALGLGGVVLGASGLLYALSPTKEPQRLARSAKDFYDLLGYGEMDFSALASLKPAPAYLRVPQPLFGMAVNTPFAERHPKRERWSGLFTDVQTVGAKNVRIILDYEYRDIFDDDSDQVKDSKRKENEIIIEQVRAYVQAAGQNGLGVIVDLANAFNLLSSENLAIYCTSPLSSIHIKDRYKNPAEKVRLQQEFFTGERPRKAMIGRYIDLVTRLSNLSNIVCWGVMNETYIPGDMSDEEKKSILTSWHKEMIGIIKAHDPLKRVVATSVKDPRLLEQTLGEGVVQTFQAYNWPDWTDTIHGFVQSMEMPLICHEISTPNKTQLASCMGLPDVDLPDEFATPLFLKQVAEATVVGDQWRVPHYNFWQMGFHEDGFRIDLKKNPYLIKASQGLAKAIDNVYRSLN